MKNTLDRSRLESLLTREEQVFHKGHPKSYELYQRARKSLHGGVPMLWMIRWAGSFPVFVKEARSAHFTDVDGNNYIDLCLGDTGAMTGHSPNATVKAIQEQSQKGITLMLPYEDVIWVGEELQRRFKLPYWQFALTATDANRFVLRMARMLTNRPKILVFNYCYHGSVDEALIVLDEEGTLGLATVTPQGMKVLARAEILSSNAWTAPTLAGTRLYVRDRRTIRALDLS